MRIWVVYGSVADFYPEILGVFDSKEKAEAYEEKLAEFDYNYVFVESCILNQPE